MRLTTWKRSNETPAADWYNLLLCYYTYYVDVYITLTNTNQVQSPREENNFYGSHFTILHKIRVDHNIQHLNNYGNVLKKRGRAVHRLYLRQLSSHSFPLLNNKERALSFWFKHNILYKHLNKKISFLIIFFLFCYSLNFCLGKLPLLKTTEIFRKMFI